MTTAKTDLRYAVVSDIHANLEGLEAVLKDAQEQKCTHYVCLGDIVGTAPTRMNASISFEALIALSSWGITTSTARPIST